MDANQARQMCEECLNTLYIRRELDRMKDFYAENVVSHPDFPGLPSGLPGLKAMSQAWLAAFSEVGVTLESFSQEKDHVSIQFVVTGVHTGPFLGVAPTGRRITIVDRPRYRLENGKIAELWQTLDVGEVLKQLA